MSYEYLKYVLPMRRRYQALGRTVNNRQRKNRVWPELAGLANGPEYHARYSLLRKRLI
jgi:hypothetical protein